MTESFFSPGESRTCPHCKATILKSAVVCPACQHFLRFDAVRASRQAQAVSCPLRVEGTIRRPIEGGLCEYSVVVAVQNDRGEVISRRVVGVGALHPEEVRTFVVSVEVTTSENRSG